MSASKLVFAVDENSFLKQNHIGVRKKVESQITLFKNNGIEAGILQYTWKDGLPTISIDDDVKVLYFRRIEASYRLANMLIGLKKQHPDLRILMEIPVYPFDKEKEKSKSIKRRISISLGTAMWKKCIDRIVMIGREDIHELYGIPVISANNGIDFDSVKARTIGPSDGINMIAVSGCYFWHGYDRIIKSLGEYYRGDHERELNLYIVGEGDCLKEYKALTTEQGLMDKHVFFTGVLTGEALDDVYNKCDLAVGSFGAHRKGLKLSVSLKSREYVAKGLPIVTSVDMDIENESTDKWFLKYPADESLLDINRIVEFYDKVYSDNSVAGKSGIAEEIRDDFRPLCDINDTFKGVIDYIREQ